MLKILWVLGAYLLGAVPTGYLVVKLAARRDIRTLGSRSTGATNVLRAKGWALAVLSYVRDILGQAGISIVLGIVLVRALQRLIPRLSTRTPTQKAAP